MTTHLGMTREQIDDLMIYDRSRGMILDRHTGKRVTLRDSSGLVFKKRIGDKVRTIRLGKLCYFLIHDTELTETDRVVYVDGDMTNLKPDNLELQRYSERESVVEVDRFIFFNPNNSLFVVRRGKKQAVYRTYDMNEAILIRNEWESDKTIHRWDRFMGKYVESCKMR